MLTSLGALWVGNLPTCFTLTILFTIFSDISHCIQQHVHLKATSMMCLYKTSHMMNSLMGRKVEANYIQAFLWGFMVFFRNYTILHVP